MTTRRDDAADQPRCDHRKHAHMKYPRAPWGGRIGLFKGDTDRFWEPCPEPAAPPPAPTDDVVALVADPQPEWSRDFILGYQSAQRIGNAEIRRLAADLAAARADWQFQSDTAADLFVLKERAEAERDDLRRQVAAVRALCDAAESEPHNDTGEPARLLVDDVLAALDTEDRR